MGELNPQHVARLEDAIKRFNDEPLALIRAPVRALVVAAGVILGLASLAFGWPKLGFALACLGVETTLAAFVVAGFIRPSPLFLRSRDYLLGCRGSIWLAIAVGVAAFVAALYFLSLLGVWLSVTLMALALGAMLAIALDGKVEARRKPAREYAEALVQELRGQGLKEEDAHRFFCAYGGKDWEELFEVLFGYDAKVQARQWWEREHTGPPRPRYASWREPLIEAIDRRVRQRQEEDALRAQRILAYSTSRPAALATVPPAAPIYPAAGSRPASRYPSQQPPPLPDFTSGGAPRPPRSSLGRMLHQMLMLVMGPVQRFLIGAVLLGACGWWMWQNDMIQQFRDVQAYEDVAKILRAEQVAPLKIPNVNVSESVTKWFNTFGVGVAGLLMLIAASLPNWKAALLMPFAAVVAWFGPSLGVPEIAMLTPAQASMAIGGVIGLLAIVVGRKP
jgi:hypothetical protein